MKKLFWFSLITVLLSCNYDEIREIKPLIIEVNNGKEDFQVGRCRGIDQLKGGKYLILDQVNYCVFVADKKLEKIEYKFGRKGNGPGEFTEALDIGVNNKNEIYIVFDNFINKYDSVGNFIKKIKPETLDKYNKHFLSIIFDKEDAYYLSYRIKVFNGLKKIMLLGKYKDEILIESYEIPTKKIFSELNVVDFDKSFISLLNDRLFCTLPINKKIIVFDNDNYQVLDVDKDDYEHARKEGSRTYYSSNCAKGLIVNNNKDELIMIESNKNKYKRIVIFDMELTVKKTYSLNMGLFGQNLHGYIDVNGELIMWDDGIFDNNLYKVTMD